MQILSLCVYCVPVFLFGMIDRAKAFLLFGLKIWLLYIRMGVGRGSQEI